MIIVLDQNIVKVIFDMWNVVMMGVLFHSPHTETSLPVLVIH